jgi:hypothetical protein
LLFRLPFHTSVEESFAAESDLRRESAFLVLGAFTRTLLAGIDYHSVHCDAISYLCYFCSFRPARVKRCDLSHILVGYAQNDRFCGTGKWSRSAPVENAESEDSRIGEQKANTYFRLYFASWAGAVTSHANTPYKNIPSET